MSRSWPFIIVVLLSFGLGSFWGWRLIQERNETEGRFIADSHFRLLAPAGLIPDSIIREFEKQERVAVELTSEPSPATLLRKLLKSAPGQFDSAMIFHHQLPSVRTERKLQSLYDSRNRFPIVIAPDFRKLTEDRNLMETAPLLWGFIGLASRKTATPPTREILSQSRWDGKHMTIGVWPSWLTAYLPSPETLPIELVRKISPSLRNQKSFFETTVTDETNLAVLTHGQMNQEPFQKDWSFTSLDHGYPLWILTSIAVADGNTELARKWLHFLLEPTVSREFTIKSRGGASTLRTMEEADIPKELKPSYLRSIPIQDVLLDRDERIRQADDLIEQTLAGAQLSAPTPTPLPIAPKPVVSRKKPATAPIETSAKTSEHASGQSEEASPPPSATAPSEEQSHAD